MTPAFELRGVGVSFGRRTALAGVDLELRRGERVALIGPSGAGKSTLLSLLNGSLRPGAGQVRVFGHHITRASPRELRQVQARIGTVHQGFHLVDRLRVVHNVNAGRLATWTLPRALLSLCWPRDTASAVAALRRVGLADRLHDRTDRLSGGEQQRVAIARVLAQAPDAILADEPIASVDPARGREIIDLLLELSAERGTTLLASLHDSGMALDRFERVVGLRHGRIAFDMSPSRLEQAALRRLYATERDRAGV